MSPWLDPSRSEGGLTGQSNICQHAYPVVSRLAQLVERVTSNDEVSRSSRLMGICEILRQRFFALQNQTPRPESLSDYIARLGIWNVWYEHEFIQTQPFTLQRPTLW